MSRRDDAIEAGYDPESGAEDEREYAASFPEPGPCTCSACERMRNTRGES